MKSLRIAAIISAILAIAKAFAFTWTGSLVVLASFLDSFVDSLLSFVNFKISKLAKEIPDRRHPYGHGGFEVLTSMIQGALIAGSGVIVLVQSLDRTFAPKSIENLTIDRLPVALVIMLVSTIASLVITKILSQSKKELTKSSMRSMSINADHAHYVGDAQQNVVTLIGLSIAWYFKSSAADIVAGFISSFILIRAAYPLIRDSVKDIMNTEFDPLLRASILKIIHHCGIPEVQGVHRLRTRTLGPNHFVDFHLKLPNQMTLIEAHDISYKIEALLKTEIPGLDVIMHLDPEAEPDDEFDEF